MCSIVGYIGSKSSREAVLDGLTRLEYRGYDSAGFACYDEEQHRIVAIRTVGSVADLRHTMDRNSYNAQGPVGIGHTRWSTHGVVSELNAHPVSDCTGRVFVVQNGTLENDALLRAEFLAKGHHFASQTDSELIAHCAEEELSLLNQEMRHEVLTTEQLAHLLHKVVHRLQGTYAFILLLEQAPDVLLIARYRLPLCIGIGSDVMYVASDGIACAGLVDRMLFMPDQTYAVVKKGEIQLFSWEGEQINAPIEQAAISWDPSGKRGYAHYMLKEIYEQCDALQALADYGQSDVRAFMEQHPSMIKEPLIRMVGCGTSAHAAHLAQPFFEDKAALPTAVLIATDMRERPLFHPEKSWALVLSQSGETADVLESVRLMQERGMSIVGITNVATSALARAADHTLLIRAGAEIAVASTKTLVAHVAMLYLIAYELSYARGKSASDMYAQARQNLAQLAVLLAYELKRQVEPVYRLASSIASLSTLFVIGRSVSYAVAREIALKIKEIAYIFAEACPAGELKHGPLALIDTNTHVLVCSVLDEIAYRKLIINVQQIRSRNGKILSILFEGQEELIALSDEYIMLEVPQDPLLAPLLMVSVAQYMAYQVALILGRPVDKPRNLAKSVTVE